MFDAFDFCARVEGRITIPCLAKIRQTSRDLPIQILAKQFAKILSEMLSFRFFSLFLYSSMTSVGYCTKLSCTNFGSLVVKVLTSDSKVPEFKSWDQVKF